MGETSTKLTRSFEVQNLSAIHSRIDDVGFPRHTSSTEEVCSKSTSEDDQRNSNVERCNDHEFFPSPQSFNDSSFFRSFESEEKVCDETPLDKQHPQRKGYSSDYDDGVQISGINDDNTVVSSDPVDTDETEAQRLQRETEASEALARQFMAEEAMASYSLSAEYLRDNADHFSSEDLAVIQAALAEEAPEDSDNEGAEDICDEGSEELSYDALLQLGAQIGSVKEERWALVAKEKIEEIPTIVFEPLMAEGKDENHTEVKCLICQFSYNDRDVLRRLPCEHCFHKECVDGWLRTKDTCALCRKSIVSQG